MDFRFTKDETDPDDDSAYWKLVGLPPGSLVLEYAGEPVRDHFYAPYRGRYTAAEHQMTKWHLISECHTDALGSIPQIN